jgi:hypothetical protein
MDANNKIADKIDSIRFGKSELSRNLGFVGPVLVYEVAFMNEKMRSLRKYFESCVTSVRLRPVSVGILGMRNEKTQTLPRHPTFSIEQHRR